jgi:glycosyltransferase involved in cell wall biosynthesis
VSAVTPGAEGGAGCTPLLLGLGWDRSGGLNRYLQGLQRALEEDGTPTRTLVFGPAGRPPAQVHVVAGEDDALPVRLWRYARAARSEARQGTVVDVHFALFAWWPVRWGSLRSTPLVVHFHGPWAQESVASGQFTALTVRVKLAVERSVYRRAHAVVVLSEAFKRLLVQDYGVAPWRVHVIAPGVDLEQFSPDRAGARARLGGPPGRVVFTARRLVPRMGLMLLLEAWAALRADGVEATLLVAGDGPQRGELEDRLAALGLSDSVRLLGEIDEDELVDRYRSADLCVLPSLSLEGFGLAAVEALACGTPVVVTDVGGLPEVVRDLDRRLVVPAADPAGLAARLAEALVGDVPDEKQCRAHAETFSWPRAARANRDVYLGAAEGAAPPPDATGRRIRVVYLDHCAALSGAEIALSRLLPALPDVEAHVVLAEDGPLVPLLQESAVSVEVRRLASTAQSVGRGQVRPGRLPLAAGLGAVRYTVGLALHLRRLRPDLVHTNSLKAAVYGSVAGRLAGVPVVWHARDRVAEDYLPGAAARLVRAVARRLPAAVIANSHATLDTLQLPQRGGFPVRVVGDPYQPPAAAVDRPARAAGELVVGMVGRLAPWKGQHVFLEAFARACPDGGARAVLVGSAMFGETDYERSLRALIDDLRLSDRVTMLGFCPDVAAELAGMDVLVHASVLPEPFGQVVVEGMAAGLPVIASEAGGPAEIITHGVDGLLHAPGDVAALSAVLGVVVTDSALRARLGSAGRVTAEQFRPALIAPQVTAAYREVLQWP